MESGVSAMIGALGGVNMISGAGMLDFLACLSPEKLVLDAEAISMAQRMLRGIEVLTDPLATIFYAGLDFKPDFLKQKLTRQLFAKEQYLPSPVIDRGSIRAWQESGSLDSFARARRRTGELLEAYRRPSAGPEQEQALCVIVGDLARQAGMDRLPPIDL
jgi:trimethylamine--corrinoid protein Co-methyltransferase